jgi:hypothetical protein
MYAFLLVHFGANTRYLELELYLLINLRKYTKYDIIYLYSITDTPQKFIDIVSPYCTKTVPYNDDKITYNVQFNSYYKHFNLLRTCNFIFGYLLTEYKKICTVESDMVIVKNIDDIFELKTPSMLVYTASNLLKNQKILKKNINTECNGGIMLFKPSVRKYNEYVKNIKYIIDTKFPNESLFIYSNKTLYNLPYKYNSHGFEYELNQIKEKYKIEDMKEYIVLLHFKVNVYKHIDVIRDNYLIRRKRTRPLIYYYLSNYKKEYYDKYNKMITKMISGL